MSHRASDFEPEPESVVVARIQALVLRKLQDAQGPRDHDQAKSEFSEAEPTLVTSAPLSEHQRPDKQLQQTEGQRPQEAGLRRLLILLCLLVSFFILASYLYR